jgi:hypothetical protein
MWFGKLPVFIFAGLALLTDHSPALGQFGIAACSGSDQAFRNAGAGRGLHGLPIGAFGSGPGSPEGPICSSNCRYVLFAYTKPLRQQHRARRRYPESKSTGSDSVLGLLLLLFVASICFAAGYSTRELISRRRRATNLPARPFVLRRQYLPGIEQ